jgi:hypothetical protein
MPTLASPIRIPDKAINRANNLSSTASPGFAA